MVELGHVKKMGCDPISLQMSWQPFQLCSNMINAVGREQGSVATIWKRYDGKRATIRLKKRMDVIDQILQQDVGVP